MSPACPRKGARRSLRDFDSTESIVAIATLIAMGVLGLVLVRRDLGSRRGQGLCSSR